MNINLKNYFPATVLGFAASCLLMPIANAAIAPADMSDKYGRSAAEYFFTPIIGINYVDITSISQNFFEPDGAVNVNNDVNVNHSELGVVFGFLIDGQYQVMATDYWRAGFQTGLIYAGPAESEFEANLSNGTAEDGSLSVSSVQLPLYFTFSRYASNDRYIATFKVGPVVTQQMYDLDMEGFEPSPGSEQQILIALGLDGRLRLGQSNNFLLSGFTIDLPVVNGGGNGFSGVGAVGNFLVYVGMSFS